MAVQHACLVVFELENSQLLIVHFKSMLLTLCHTLCRVIYNSGVSVKHDDKSRFTTYETCVFLWGEFVLLVKQ